MAGAAELHEQALLSHRLAIAMDAVVALLLAARLWCMMNAHVCWHVRILVQILLPGAFIFRGMHTGACNGFSCRGCF